MYIIIKAFQICRHLSNDIHPRFQTLKVGTRVVDTGLNVCSVCI